MIKQLAVRFHRRYDIPASGRMQLNPRRIYILPTRFGMMYGIIVAVMLIGSINYDNNLALGFTFLLIGLALVTILHTHRNLSGLQLRSGHAQPVFAGGTAQFPLHFSAPRSPARQAVGIRIGRRPAVLIAVRAEPGQFSTAVLRVAAPQRGLLAPGRCTIFTEYPLGLFRAWAWVTPSSSCLVYPHPESGPVPPVPIAEAEASTSRRGQTGREDFRGLRLYQPGDSPRHLSWKAASADLQPYAKQFEGDAGGEGWLDWDQIPDMPPEARLSRLCRWILDSHAAGHRYGLRLPGVCIALGNGEQHKHRCLEALARFQLPQAFREPGP